MKHLAVRYNSILLIVLDITWAGIEGTRLGTEIQGTGGCWWAEGEGQTIAEWDGVGICYSEGEGMLSFCFIV